MMKLYLQTDFQAPLTDYISQHELGLQLLDHALKDSYLTHEKDYAIAVTEKGKPYLADYPDIQFNISHCPMAVAVVVSDGTRQVGVDVQHAMSWNEKLAQRSCTQEERAHLAAQADERQRALLLRKYWCRKEAMLKCLGIGLTVDLRQVDTIERDALLQWDTHWFTFMEYTHRQFQLCLCEEI